MRAATTPRNADRPPALYLAFELGEVNWKLGFTTGLGQRPRERTIPARDLARLFDEITAARRRFRCAASVQIVSCYEAGREGFWLHRALCDAGVENRVVDSASIEVQRRRRRAKSDRLDLASLLRLLVRFHHGEARAWSVVHVPTPEQEDLRQLHRELLDLKRDRTRVTNRIKGLLASQGLRLPLTAQFPAHLDAACTWEGAPLSPDLHARILRAWDQVRFLTRQVYSLEALQLRLLRTSELSEMTMVRQLLHLRGIGVQSAWLFTMEFFAWRHFRNRRQLGALAGLTPTPYQSGQSHREQGISKAGNRYVRVMAIEIAWSWLRRQPESQLARWYNARFGHGSSRLRRIGIVALARKLLIELWRYLETGVLPEGAQLKTA